MTYTNTNIGFKLPANTADGIKQSLLANQIQVRPYNRRSQDLTSWRNATRAAESLIPRRTLLYDLYHDISTTDGHIISTWGKREDAVTTADWIFTDMEGNPVDSINQIIDCIGFEELIKLIISSKAWGYRMAEPSFFINDNGMNEMSLYKVPAKNMRPHLGIIAYDEVSDNGINVREGIYAKTILEVGDPSDLGLLLSAAQYAILKRGDVSDWAEFVEIFGRGIVDATWDGFDLSQRDKLAEEIAGMGGGGVILHPEGTKIDIKNNTGNANGQLQESFATWLNKEISKALLGTTETTESSKSSGYAQAKTHQENDDQKHETDITFVRRILNSRFIRILKAAGFDTKGGTFVLKSERQLSKKEAFDIHKSMAKDLNLPVDDDFFYEEYEMPKPKDYDQQKKQRLEAQNAQISNKNGVETDEENADTPPDSEGKKDKVPPKSSRKKVNLSHPDDDDGKELARKVQEAASRFIGSLKSFFGSAPATSTGATMRQQAKNCCGNHHIALSLPTSVFDEDKLIQRFWEAKGTLVFDGGLFNYFAQSYLDAFKKGWTNHPINLADIGFTYGVDDPALLSAYEMNLFHFSAAKTLAEAQELNRLFREANNYETFYQNAKLKTEVFNKTWQETEYNSAMLTGEAAATYRRLISRIEAFPYWEYRTQQDSRVRPEHAELNGLILPANDPIWKKIFPPNGWNCRCYILPRMKHEVEGKVNLKEMRKRAYSYFSSDEYQKGKAQGWGVNRGESGEVFTANQFYIRKFQDKASKKLGQLFYNDYGLKTTPKMIAEATEAMPVYEGDAAEWFNEREQGGSIAFTDYKGRKPLLSSEQFKGHTEGSKENRTLYLNAMEETMANPDEVWLSNFNNTQKLNNYVYIKYYDKSMMLVITRLESLSLEVRTWFKADMELTDDLKKQISKVETLVKKRMLDPKWKFRRGLLIKTKP